MLAVAFPPRTFIASLLAFLFALALYTATAAPTFGWGDSADLAMRMVTESDTTFIGTSRDYPLYRALGEQFVKLPLGGDIGYRANLLSGFCAALCVGLLVALGTLLSGSLAAGLAAGAALSVSHSFWLMAVIAEVYSFNNVLVLLSFVGIVYWWQTGQRVALLFAAFGAGLALTHHSTGLLLAATLAPLLFARIRQIGWRWAFALVAVYLLCAWPFWERSWLRLEKGREWLDALGLQSPSNPFFEASPLRELAKFMAFTAYNFLGAGLLLAIAGCYTILRKRWLAALPCLLWLGLIIVAGITSSIPDKFNIYVLGYPVIALLVGLGVNALPQRWQRGKRLWLLLVTLLLLPPLGYQSALYASEHFRIDLVGARTAPYRDNNRYFLWPPKAQDTGPRRYAEEALEALPRNAVLLADYSLWRPIFYLQQLEQKRTDIRLIWVERYQYTGIANFIASIPCPTPVYLATDTPPEYYQLDAIRKRFPTTRTHFLVHVQQCH